MRQCSVISGARIDRASVKIPISLFFLCFLLLSAVPSTAWVVPPNPYYAQCPAPFCFDGGQTPLQGGSIPAGTTYSVAPNQAVSGLLINIGQYNYDAAPDPTWGYLQNSYGALVLFIITGTRPDGTPIENPEQYLTTTCALTDGAGNAVTAFRSPVPGRYNIRVFFECSNNVATKRVEGSWGITVTSPITIPVASFTATPSSGQAPLQVLFEGSASDPEGISYYLWNFGDGSATHSGEGDVTSTWHTYQNARTYTATLTVTDGQSQQGSTTRQITVTPPPVQNTPPVASFTAEPTNGKAPLNVLFDASASSDAEDLTFLSSYSWNFGDGSTGQTKTVYHQYQNPRTYTATLTVTDQDGLTGTATRQIIVEQNQVNTAPVASFTANPSSGQAPLTVLFDASSSSDADGISSWSWNFGDGSSGQGVTVSHLYASAGTYTAILTVIDLGSPKLPGSTTRQITVTDIPVQNMPPVAMFTVGRASGNSLVLQLDGSGSTDSDGSITAYTWTFGDGATATGQKVTHTYASAAQYPVTLQVKDNKGASGTLSLQITVGSGNQEETKPQVQFTVRESTDVGASTNSITADASASTDPDGILVYYWNWGDGTKVEMSTTPVLSHTYASAGQYVVSVSVVDSTGSSGSASQQVNVPIDDNGIPLEPLIPILALIAGIVILLRRR